MDDPPRIDDTEELIARQREREHSERRRADDAVNVDEERTAVRRADKAAYLREKLEEQAEHPDDPG